MKKYLLSIFCVLLMTSVVIANTSGIGTKERVAKLDNEVITKSTLENYVNEFLSADYKKLLKTEDGLKQLADYYINRQILLERARNEIDSKNDLIKGHMHDNKADSKTENTMYITAYLKQNINDKIKITKSQMQDYMEKHNINSKREAEIKLSNEKREKIFKKLITDLRSNHSISYF